MCISIHRRSSPRITAKVSPRSLRANARAAKHIILKSSLQNNTPKTKAFANKAAILQQDKNLRIIKKILQLKLESTATPPVRRRSPRFVTNLSARTKRAVARAHTKATLSTDAPVGNEMHKVVKNLVFEDSDLTEQKQKCQIKRSPRIAPKCGASKSASLAKPVVVVFPSSTGMITPSKSASSPRRSDRIAESYRLREHYGLRFAH